MTVLRDMISYKATVSLHVQHNAEENGSVLVNVVALAMHINEFGGRAELQKEL